MINSRPPIAPCITFGTALCPYANFPTSYRRIDGISYTVYPGEWIYALKELSSWFRTRFQHQALRIMEKLQQQHLISYRLLDRGKAVKYKIRGWKFQISDILIDKEEVAMVLNIKLDLPDESESGMDTPTLEHEVCVSDELLSVSKQHIELVILKMAKTLSAQGIRCFGCPKSKYKLLGWLHNTLPENYRHMEFEWYRQYQAG